MERQAGAQIPLDWMPRDIRSLLTDDLGKGYSVRTDHNTVLVYFGPEDLILRYDVKSCQPIAEVWAIVHRALLLHTSHRLDEEGQLRSIVFGGRT